MAPFIASCPENQTRLVWQNFPALNVLNNPNPARRDPNATRFKERVSDISPEESCGADCGPGLAQVRPIPLSYPGKEVYLEWEAPGKAVGPNQSYITNTTAGAPAFVAWVTQLNVTYSPLMDIMPNNTGKTIQPDVQVYGVGDPAINGTVSSLPPPIFGLCDFSSYPCPFGGFELFWTDPPVTPGRSSSR